MTKKLLPLGTIIYLEEGNQKIMVVARGAVYQDSDSGKDVYFDYMGCRYPAGIDPEDGLFFNEDNIDKVLFEGYKDEDEERFLELYEEWENDLAIEKKEIY